MTLDVLGAEEWKCTNTQTGLQHLHHQQQLLTDARVLSTRNATRSEWHGALQLHICTHADALPCVIYMTQHVWCVLKGSHLLSTIVLNISNTLPAETLLRLVALGGALRLGNASDAPWQMPKPTTCLQA